MKKFKKQLFFLKKVFHFYLAINLLFFNVVSFLPLSQKVRAAERPKISTDLKLSFDSNKNELTIIYIKDNTPSEFELAYEHKRGNQTLKEGVLGRLEPKNGIEEKTIFLGTCSKKDCVKHQVQKGKVVLTTDNVERSFVIHNGKLWYADKGKYTFSEPVKKGITYTYPENSNVQIIFTKLPSNPGTLSIEEVKLTKEQQRKLNALSDTAYNITTDMKNGTFEYTLRLPLPKIPPIPIQIIYFEHASDLKNLKNIKKIRVETPRTKNIIEIKNLTHMTIFVPAAPSSPTPTPTLTPTPTPTPTPQLLVNYHFDSCNFSTAIDSSGNGNNASLLNIEKVGGYSNQGILVNDIHDSLVFSTPLNLGTEHTIAAFIKFAKAEDGLTFETSYGVGYGVRYVSGELQYRIGSSGWISSGYTPQVGKWYHVAFSRKNTTYSGMPASEFRFYVNGSNIKTKVLPWAALPGLATPVVLYRIGNNNSLSGSGSFAARVDEVVIYKGALNDSEVAALYSSYSYSPQNCLVIPVNLGFNIRSKSSTPEERPVDIACGGATNGDYPTYGNGMVAHNWEAVGNPSGALFYREWKYPGSSSWISGGASSLNYTDFGYFGTPDGIEGEWNTRVRSWFDIDGDGQLNENIDDVSDWSNECTIIYDRTSPPAPTILYPNEDDYFNTTPILNDWTDVSDLSGIDYYQIEYQYDDGHSFPGGPYITSTVSQRNHTPAPSEQGGVKFRVRAIDKAGNVGAWSSWRHYYYDATAPTSTIYIQGDLDESKNIVGDGGWHGYGWYESYDNVNLRIQSGDQAKDLIVYQLLNGDVNCPAAGDSSYTTAVNHDTNIASDVNALGNGIHTLCYYAEDLAGNRENTVHKQLLKIDNQSPSYTINYNSINGREVNGVYYIDENKITLDLNIADSLSGYTRTRYDLYLADSNGNCSNDPSLRFNGDSLGHYWKNSDTLPPVNSGVDHLIREGLPEGHYCLRIWGYDDVQNKAWQDTNGKEWVNFVIDTTSPTITDLQVTPTRVKAGDIITIKAKVIDSSGILAVSADFSYNQNYSDRPSPTSVSMHSIGNNYYQVQYQVPNSWREGTVYIKVAARDNTGGNWTRSNNYVTIEVDNTAPLITLTQPSNNSIHSGIINLQATCNETCDYINFWWREENQSYSNVSPDRRYHYIFTDGTVFNWSLDTLNAERWGGDPSYVMTDGTYYFYAAGKDLVGNWSRTNEISVIVDNTNPTSTITTFNLPNGGQIETNNFDGLIEGTASDNLSGVDHVLLSIMHSDYDGSNVNYWDATSSAWISTPSTFRATGTDNWSYQLPDIPEGIYQVSSHAVDKAGNVEDTYTIKIIYDKTIPEVSLTVDPENPDADHGWYKTQPKVTLTATDNYRTEKIQYQWDSKTGSWTDYSTPISIPDEKQHVLYYRAIDKVGNLSEVGVKVLKWDKTKPEIAPSSLSLSKISLPKATLSWKKANDSQSGINRYEIYWKLKNEPNAPTYSKTVAADTTSTEIDHLKNGSWEIKVRAVDDAGNWVETILSTTIGPTTTPTPTPTPTIAGATTGRQFLGISTKAGEEKGKTAKEKAAPEKQEVSSKEEVKGAATSCAKGWKKYLPSILLAFQALLILGVTLFSTWTIGGKHLFAAGTTLANILLYYLLVKSKICLPGNTWLVSFDKFFWLISATIGLTFRLLGVAIKKRLES